MVNKMTVSFIGTGNMGLPLINKLLSQGYSVQIYDKYKRNMDLLVKEGAIWCNTPRKAAKGCTVVITCLPLPEHVLENMLGENGALSGMEAKATWIDTSTTDYHNTLHIASRASEQGIYSLEAPVSNLSHMGVDFANVCFYVGGDEEGYKLSRDIIDTMGRKSFYVGKIGAGQTVKLFTNLLFYTAVVVWGELLMIAKSYGIPLDWLWNFIKKSSGNCFVCSQITPFILDGSYDYSCTLEITVKDTGLTVDLANEFDVTLPIGRIVEKRYRQAGEKYDPHDNHVKVVALLEEENLIRLQIPNFSAPSPYGASRDYRHPKGVVQDDYGRITPVLPEQYTKLHYDIDKKQMNIAKIFTDFMAYINFSILKESCELGRRMGFDEILLRDVVRWSCGPSWVADHEDSFQPDQNCIHKVSGLIEGLELPVIQQLLNVLPAEPVSDLNEICTV